ncbi:hypothetical protein AEAC466_04475 [Asticcacaulis sp. AC466]|uniref:hypothetical protein n=1 Tax=Asticcacaulis sp. AC466 TaxID=1282362 RepID=UPI0003C3B640|nr:hypothetical protein [Asticcacaulis sp. AC466]ESQ85425.1 hypothetical protein AEAC466_04475 [Asticcacaulis sp. AC466]
MTTDTMIEPDGWYLHRATNDQSSPDWIVEFMRLGGGQLTSGRGADLPAAWTNAVANIEAAESGLVPTQENGPMILSISKIFAAGTKVAFDSHSGALRDARAGDRMSFPMPAYVLSEDGRSAIVERPIWENLHTHRFLKREV